MNKAPSVSSTASNTSSISSTINNQIPSVSIITNQTLSISSTVTPIVNPRTTVSVVRKAGSHRTAEGKKNVQKLQEILYISEHHVDHYFHQFFPRDPKQLYQALKPHKYAIKALRSKGDIKCREHKLIFPDDSDETDSSQFDLPLFRFLIANFSPSKKPKMFWYKPPKFANDHSDEANIARLFTGRNLIQHCPSYISNNQYNDIAKDVIDSLVSLGEDKQKLQNLLPPIQYGLSKPVSNFFGRDVDLQEIHKIVQNGKNDFLLVVVHGMAGIGKSETIRQYCDQFGHFFDNNILWIKAANGTSLGSSFIDIADMVGLDIRDENKGHLKRMNTIITSVYKYFQNTSMLYVFDDVSNIQSITPFLPTHKPSTSIITTQLKDWSHINCKLHELKTFKPSESKCFLTTNLADDLMDGTQLKRVLKQLGGHPLALQQFVVAITKTMLSVEEYVELLEKETAKILELKLTTMNGGKSAIKIITEKLFEDKHTKLAFEILNTISYFYADEISLEVVKLTFPCKNIIDIENAVQKLASYSLIKVSSKIISIHSLIQKSMIYQHKNSENKYFEECLRMFQDQFHVAEENFNHECFGKTWYKHLIHFITMNIGNTKIHNMLLENVDQILDALKTKGKIDDLIKLYECLLKTLIEKSGPALEKSVKTKFNLARCYQENCQYEKAIELYKKVFNEQMKLYGKTQPSTLLTMHHLAACLQQNGKLDKAIKIYKEVLDKRSKILGKTNPSTLKTMNNLAVCFKGKGKLGKAIELHGEVLNGRLKLYGTTHQSFLRTMNNLAICFHLEKRLDEAIQINETVRDKQLLLHGKTHPSTLLTMNNLALCFKDKGSLDEAIKINEEVLGERMKLYGKRHHKTLQTMNNLAVCYKDTGRTDEAIKLLQEVLDQEIKLHGKKHPSTLETMSNLESCFADKRTNQKL